MADARELQRLRTIITQRDAQIEELRRRVKAAEDRADELAADNAVLGSLATMTPPPTTQPAPAMRAAEAAVQTTSADVSHEYVFHPPFSPFSGGGGRGSPPKRRPFYPGIMPSP